MKKETSKDVENEINQVIPSFFSITSSKIKLNSKGGKLVIGDDSGSVSIIDTKNFDIISTEKSHDVICASVGFLPNDEYFSGGMDCKFFHYKPKKTLKIDFSQQLEQKQIVNPPLIHSLATNSKFIAAGLGNSKCQLIDVSK